MTDTYTRIKVILHTVTRDALQVSATDKGSFPDPVWLPRSLIHGGDDPKLARAMKGDTIEIRVMEWKAKETGLAGNRPAPDQGELLP